MQTIAVINGPNLNRLGKREPEIYGSETLADLENRLRSRFSNDQVKLSFYQSNHEGALIDKIEALTDSGCDGIVINPGAFTHTSVALHDALAGARIPSVEVHISNIYAREEFRKNSITAAACHGVISGLGFFGYDAAVEYLLALPR